MEWLQGIFDLPEGSIVMVLLVLVRRLISLIGVFIILWGACEGVYQFFSKCREENFKKMNLMDLIRVKFGRKIILGLEFIVAADVIETTTAPDYYTLGILASLVVIRTFLTFFMNKELTHLTK